MQDAAATSESMAHFPPGAQAPTAATRDLRDPAHLSKLNAGLAAWKALPEEEQRRIKAERKVAKAARVAAREAKRKPSRPRARSRGAASPLDDAPPTERSSRGSTLAPTGAPDSDIPRGRMAARGELSGIIDLCSALPNLGDGTCFIQVTRVKPAMAFNMATAGVQKPIWDVIDDAEFSQAYGGAEYRLRGYALKDGGKARALTDPVTYQVSGPPNLESALTEEDTMLRPNPQVPINGALRRPGMVTPHAATAEADMFRAKLNHDETMDERTARRDEERLRRDSHREQEREGRHLDVARLLSENKDKEMDRLREMQEKQLELAQQNNKGDNGALIAKVLEVLKPGQDTQGLIVQHSAEIKQISESHKQEMIRLTDQQRGELTRLTETHGQTMRRLEDQAKADRERADGLVRESERRAADQIREVERRSDARVLDIQNQARAQYDDLKNRSEERVRDQDKSWQQRFDDLKEANAREIRQKDSEIQLMRSNLEGNQSVILAGKDSEIKRLQHDLRDARELAEKNKDWVGKIGEFEKTAETLGFSKGGGEGEGSEDDLKTTAVKAGLGMLQRLPELVASAGEAISKVRNPNPGVPPEQARAQSRAGMVRGSMRTMPRSLGSALQPLTFATEDGAGYTPPGESTPPRANPIPYAQPQSQPLPALEQSSTHSTLHMPQQQQLVAPQQQFAQQAPPQPQHQQPAFEPPPPPLAPPAPSGVSPPPSAQATENDPVVLAVVEQFAPLLAHQFDQRIQPEEVARQIIATNGIELTRTALGIVTIEQMLRIITTNPAYPALGTRNGQKFLREIWKHAEQQAAGASEQPTVAQ